MRLVLLILTSCGYELVRPGDTFVTAGGAATCESLGKSCGTIQDGAGTVLDCGTCAEGEVCGAAGVANVCCTPTTCAEQGATCGELSDGCGGVVECGSCAIGETCGAGGPNVCGVGACTPVSCADLGFDCGIVQDGCGATLECGACGGSQTCGGAGQPNVCGDEGVVIPTALETGCFGWPDSPFTATNFAQLQAGLPAGSLAIDFTLRDLAGQSHVLSDLLATKPVVIQFGSYTCPVFQRKIADSDALAAAYADRVHFLVVYTIEAHPASPDPSPYRGRVWSAEYSDRGQAMTYADRASFAGDVALGAEQLMLVDEIGATINPIWCTYGPAPNAGYLIDQDGTIAAAQTWFDAASMRTAIEGVLAR